MKVKSNLVGEGPDGWVGMVKYFYVILNSQLIDKTKAKPDHMMAQVHCSFAGIPATCHIWHASGGDYLNDPIEVEIPDELKGIVHYESLRQSMDSYYRFCIDKFLKNLHNAHISTVTDSIIEQQGSDWIKLADTPAHLGWELD